MDSELTKLQGEVAAAVAHKLADLFATIEKAKERIEQHANAAIQSFERPMGKQEAAEFLGISHPTLERRMREGDGPPRHRVGKFVQFYASELAEWRKKSPEGNGGKGARRARVKITRH